MPLLPSIDIDKLPPNAGIALGKCFIPMKNLATGNVERIPVETFINPSTSNYNWVSTTSYSIGALVSQSGKIYKSLVNANIGVLPSTDVTKWELQNKSPGSSLQPWQSGVYTEDNVYVTYKSGGLVQLYELEDMARPFNSTDFPGELIDNKWKVFGNSAYTPPDGMVVNVMTIIDIAAFPNVGRSSGPVLKGDTYPLRGSNPSVLWRFAGMDIPEDSELEARQDAPTNDFGYTGWKLRTA